MDISTRSMAFIGATGAVPAGDVGTSAGPAARAISAETLMRQAGLDADATARLLGPDNLHKMQASIDELSHTDQRTLEVLADTWKVPGTLNWRDVLGDIRSLDPRDQGRALGSLAMRIDQLPNGDQKLQLMDAIRDALDDLRGQAAIDGLWGFARGVGLAYRNDPVFESYVAGLKNR
jgi:hypothetical protein